MIKQFKENPSKDQVNFKGDLYLLIKETYEYSPELGGEIAISWMEYLLTGDMSTDNEMIQYIIKNGSLSKDKKIYVSKGQDRVRRYLEENNIPYKQEYVVKINGHNRRFDFAIFDEQGIAYFIEYDGEQHYKVVEQWGGEEGLIERQRVDKEKDHWAEEQGKFVIRVPYWIKPEELEDYIKNSYKC